MDIGFNLFERSLVWHTYLNHYLLDTRKKLFCEELTLLEKNKKEELYSDENTHSKDNF